VSDQEYLLDPDNPNDVIVADRKGLVLVKSTVDKKELRIQSRRILPVSVGNRVPVIESGNKYRVVCNKCQHVLEVTGSIEEITCPKCSTALPLFWIGDRPMKDSATTDTTGHAVHNVPKTKSSNPKPQANKMDKPQTVLKKETQPSPKVDLASLAHKPHLELWTKKSVKFDHVEVDVQAHALIFSGNNPRKLCFNTYDGALGKKSTSLPVDAFIHDREVTTTDKAAHKPWFAIKDLDKARAQLKKNGYEKV